MPGGGRRGGSNGHKVRPTLPFKLAKELGGGDAKAFLGRRGGSSNRKARRKEERQAKKHKPRPQPTPKQAQKPVAGAKRPAGASGPEQLPSAKKSRKHASLEDSRAKKPPRASGSKFDDLLPAAKDPELALQRELAKKLGLKKGKKLSGGYEDGMDELFEEFGGLNDLFDDNDDDKLSYKSKKSNKKSIKYSVAASESDSDEEAEEASDEEELGTTSEEEDSHLGGVSELNHEHDDLGFELFNEDDDSEDSEEEENDLEEERNEEESSSEEEEEEGGEEGESEEEKEKGEIKGAEPQTAAVPAAAVASGKYVPPAARRAQLAAAGGATASASLEEERIARRVRGLLNRLAETNLPGIVGELAELYQSEGRSVVGNAVATELLAAAAEGPRASDRFAAVAAAAVSGLAGLSNSSGVVAMFIDKIASRLESAMASATEDSLAAGNLVQVIAHLFLSGALKSDLIFSLLEHWKDRFSENDVVAMAGLLGAAGLALRAADPERMKTFVVAVHAKVAERINAGNALSTRARVMLDLVVDIKNNRKREGGGRKVVQLDAAAAKWLRSCAVGSVAVGGITWKKVLTGDKRGHWWLPTAADAAANLARNFGTADSESDDDYGGDGGARRGAGLAAAAAGIGSDAGMAAPQLLKLASAMRMNTDSRRAVFCAVMGSEDAVDAFEKLLRLGLKGDQEREIVRVTVECCLHETAYNPYYTHLLIRLCNVSKGHRITLQYCLWDHFKEVSGTDVRRMTNLAKMSAGVVAGFAVPCTMLKAVDFATSFSAREVLFWRLFFEHLFAGIKSDADFLTIFQKIATQQQLGPLKLALAAFLKRSVGPWLATKDPSDPSQGGAERLSMLLKRCRMAERALLGRM